MAILTIIGITLLVTVIGGVIVQATSKKDNGIKRLFKEQQRKAELKRKEKEYRMEVRARARLKALQELDGELVKIMKKEELEKMSGNNTKNKLKKFADAFKIDNNDNTKNDSNNNKIEQMLGINNKNNNTSSNSGSINYDDKLKQMMSDTTTSKKSEDDILKFMK